MQYTKIYVGANNTTKELEISKIKEVLKTTQQGYTLTQGTGYYKGVEEPCVIIEIYGNYNLAIPNELKKELKQNSVLVVSDYKEVNFI